MSLEINIEDNRLKASYRRGADAYMDVGDRAMHGAIAETQNFFGLCVFFVGANLFAYPSSGVAPSANEFAPTLTALPTIGAFLRASAVNPFFINYQGMLRLLRSHLVSGSHASRSCATCEGAISNIPTPRSSARM